MIESVDRRGGSGYFLCMKFSLSLPLLLALVTLSRGVSFTLTDTQTGEVAGYTYRIDEHGVVLFSKPEDN